MVLDHVAEVLMNSLGHANDQSCLPDIGPLPTNLGRSRKKKHLRISLEKS